MNIFNENKPLILLVTYRIPGGQRAAFLDAIASHDILARTHGEEGCLQYEYFLPVEDESRLLLIEQWASARIFERHKQTPHFKELGEIKEALGVTSQLKITQEC